MYRKLLLSLAIVGLLGGPAFGQGASVSGSMDAGKDGVEGSGSVGTEGADVSGSVDREAGEASSNAATTSGTVNDATGETHTVGNN